MRSSISPPRMALADEAPMTQRKASSRLDLPHPFGPTMPVSPVSTGNSCGSTNDLKPAMRNWVICIPVPWRSVLRFVRCSVWLSASIGCIDSDTQRGQFGVDEA